MEKENNQQYFIWINESGLVSIAELVEMNSKSVTLKSPYMVTTLQYGVNSKNELINPNSPDSIKSKFTVEMSPYIFNEVIPSTTLYNIKDISTLCYTITNNQSQIAKQYTKLTEILG